MLLVKPLVVNTRICITVKTPQEQRVRMVGPLTVCLDLGLAVTCIICIIVTLAAVLEPKIQLSHRRDWVTFGYKASTHRFVSQ